MKKLEIIIERILLAAMILLLVLSVIFIAIQKRTKELDYKRIALIDDLSGNYMFRGNNPFIKKDGKKVFAYDELKDHFNRILSDSGRKTLDDFYLIDVSLLDLNEYEDLSKERAFFKKHPEKGRFIHFSTLSPSLLLKYVDDPKSTSRDITDRYNNQTATFLKHLHEILLQKSDKPVAIYLHCNAGRDRAGFLIAGYKMMFMGANLEQARSQNAIEVGRNSKNFYNQAILSYCNYIKQTRKKADNFCAVS